MGLRRAPDVRARGCRPLPDRAYTTVLTILERLRRKDFVARTTQGRVHYFAAADTREAYVAELMIDAMGSAAIEAPCLPASPSRCRPKRPGAAASPAGRHGGPRSRREARRDGRPARGLSVMLLGPVRSGSRGHSGWRGPAFGRALLAVRRARAIASGIGAGLALAVSRYQLGFAGGVSSSLAASSAATRSRASVSTTPSA